MSASPGRSQANSHRSPQVEGTPASASRLVFPGDLYYLVEHQTWARLMEDGSVVVGITSLGVALSGEIYMCRVKPIQSEVDQGKSIAVVELAKSIVSVKSPVRGVVTRVNPLLTSRPELVHLDPYGEGWLAHMQVIDFGADRAQLAHGETVAALMSRHAWLNKLK